LEVKNIVHAAKLSRWRERRILSPNGCSGRSPEKLGMKADICGSNQPTATMRLIFQQLLPALFVLAAGVSSAQQPDKWCGTTGATPWFKWYTQHRHEIAASRGGNDTTWLYVPTTLHIVGTDNGTGYYQLELALASLCETNQFFEESGARIRFYLVPGDGIRYLNNSYWYDHDYEGGSDLIQSNWSSDRMNAFFVADPAGACGYSWQDAIVLGKNCSGPGTSTMAHEAGHHLSLPHPFLGWEDSEWDYSQPAPQQLSWNEVEKTDGSNCHESGDFFCDTRPDYLSFRWNCGANSESGIVQHDPDNVAFRSDGTLIMGYANDGCHARFTPEQITAMRDNLYTEHLEYLQISEPLPAIAPDATVELISPLDTQAVQYNNFTLSWNPVENASMYIVEIGLFDSFQPKIYSKSLINGTTAIVNSTNIPLNRVLYWRVRPYGSWDVCKPEATAQIGVFKTKNFSATNELERTVAAELSPNPVAAGLPAKLQLSADENMGARLIVTDATGRQCSFQDIRLFVGDNLVDIPTETLGAGVYFVTLQNEKGTLLKRLAVID
jgi:hypothetical protein